MFKIFYLFPILISTTWVILNIDGAGNADVSVSNETQYGNIKERPPRAEKRIQRYQNRQKINCGRGPQRNKILQGTTAEPGTWPWMGILCYKRSKPGRALDCICGATLIDREWALTAAHCVKRTKDKMYLGFMVNSSFEFQQSSQPNNYIKVMVEKAHIHPLFDSVTYENDIALINVDRSDKTRIEPVCLPLNSLDDPTYLKELSWLVGWGIFNSPSQQNITHEFLRQINVRIVPLTECHKRSKALNKALEILSSKKICAGVQHGGDSCYGDSGSPMMTKLRGRWIVIGIVSKGIGCIAKGVPLSYTKVFSHLNWIAWVTKIRF